MFLVNFISVVSHLFHPAVHLNTSNADVFYSVIMPIQFSVKRALHYPFNWIRFLEMNKLCNVIAKNLTFSTNRKLISISWKVSTCSNISTNWKWKWMNHISHGRKNVLEKRRFKLIWKILSLQIKSVAYY